MELHNKNDISCPEACRAKCCNYVVKKIPAPRVKLDFDELYWFLCHEKMAVYIEQRKWYLLVEVPCRYLDEKHRCRIYPKRPGVCRIHSEENCEHTGELDFQEFMRSPADLKEYMERRGLKLRMPWIEADDTGCDDPLSRSFPQAGKGSSTKKRK